MRLPNKLFHCFCRNVSLYSVNSEAGQIELIDLKDLAKPEAWQGIVTLYVLSSVLAAQIATYHPTTNVATSAYSRTVRGRVQNHHKIYIMFTDLWFQERRSRDFQTKHFVPLIEKVRYGEKSWN